MISAAHHQITFYVCLNNCVHTVNYTCTDSFYNNMLTTVHTTYPTYAVKQLTTITAARMS